MRDRNRPTTPEPNGMQCVNTRGGTASRYRSISPAAILLSRNQAPDFDESLKGKIKIMLGKLLFLKDIHALTLTLYPGVGTGYHILLRAVQVF